jgi:hypothetical protein
MRPQEIQVGILKRLRGTPIVRHDEGYGMQYSPHAPYEVLQTNAMDFNTLQRMRRFARFWDLVANSGNFVELTPLIWLDDSPFHSFMRLSDWMADTAGRTHGIALNRLAEMLVEFLTAVAQRDPAEVEARLRRDFEKRGRTDIPGMQRQLRHAR